MITHMKNRQSTLICDSLTPASVLQIHLCFRETFLGPFHGSTMWDHGTSHKKQVKATLIRKQSTPGGM